MTTDYNATIEYDWRADVVLPVDLDQLVDALVEYHPAIGGSPRGWLEVTITLPADTLAQASTTALAVVDAAMATVARTRKAIASQVLTTAEFDAREGMAPMASVIGTAEAAEILGVSQQRVAQLVGAGAIGAMKAGRSLALARAEVEAFAQRDRKSGRPRTRT